MTQPAVPPRFQLTRMISSVWIPQALYAAAKLGVPDALAAGPQPSEKVAHAVGAHAGATHRLLRALAALGLVVHREDGAFELTPLGRPLTADAPDSVRSWALLWGGPMMWEPWGRLADCVRTGELAPKLLAGFDTSFELMQAHPEDAAHFNRSMLELTRGLAPVLPAAYDFAGARTVVDVGGGFGALLPPVLRAHPTLRGVVYDLPRCAEGSRELMAREGLADRCEFRAGDFFASVPGGGDVYLLKSVIHDWDDARSLEILRRCRDALSGAAKLLVLEWPVPERVGPNDVGIVGTDLNMLVMVGGIERTLAEYRALLQDAGLSVTRVIPTPAGMHVIEAARA
ncbi:MAG TPA: methyltransferase [Myxococcota bacterium]|nr:methyltransferase [Myxococcota bacterium]